MADKIKGITIEFKGNASQLQKSIRDTNKEIAKTQKELTAVNKALKFNPTSVELWRQKQELLTKKVEDTKTQLAFAKEFILKYNEGLKATDVEYIQILFAYGKSQRLMGES